MASQEPTYTPEFKAKVANKALAQSKKNLDSLSEKYDVPVSLILTWATQLERDPDHVFAATNPEKGTGAPETEEVVVDVNDEDTSEGLDFGVMHDDFDFKNLVFWVVCGVACLVIFVQILRYMYRSNMDALHHRSAKKIEHYQVNQEKKADNERLATYGVVDLKKGIYRMPIDTVIDEMAVDVNTK